MCNVLSYYNCCRCCSFYSDFILMNIHIYSSVMKNHLIFIVELCLLIWDVFVSYLKKKFIKNILYIKKIHIQNQKLYIKIKIECGYFRVIASLILNHHFNHTTHPLLLSTTLCLQTVLFAIFVFLLPICHFYRDRTGKSLEFGSAIIQNTMCIRKLFVFTWSKEKSIPLEMLLIAFYGAI